MIVLFKPSSRTSGDHPAFEYPGTMMANEACAIGETLKMDASGLLTKASGTDVPEFVAMQPAAAAASPAVKPAVVRVDEMQEWQTTVGAGTAPIVPGTKLTIHTDGLTTTTTAGTGAFCVTSTTKAYTVAAATGDIVFGMFRR
jgi:hypothetical protein